MCFFPLNLLPTFFPSSKLLGLIVNESHPNVLYASLSVFIVPFPFFLHTIFGFFTYQFIALSSTPNTQIFLFLHQHCFFFISLEKTQSYSLRKIFSSSFSSQDFYSYFHNKIHSIRTN